MRKTAARRRVVKKVVVAVPEIAVAKVRRTAGRRRVVAVAKLVAKRAVRRTATRKAVARKVAVKAVRVAAVKRVVRKAVAKRVVRNTSGLKNNTCDKCLGRVDTTWLRLGAAPFPAGTV